jgi:hypothetical protein
MPLVLPGGGTKQVTLFVPGSSVGGSVEIQFRDAQRVYATTTNSPSPFDQGDVSVGVLSSDPASLTWLDRVYLSTGNPVSLVRLTTGTLDALPDALANFDLIVIADGSVSRLDGDQLSALEQYVRAGGALVLVGGPGWQETLRPLPAALIPGRLTSTRTLPNLLGLLQIQRVALPRQEIATAVGVLRNPQGTVLASEQGVPLAVEHPLGAGQVLYLAFDPSLDPIAHWEGARAIVNRLILRTIPSAAGRPTTAQGGLPPTLFVNSYSGPSNIGSELSNVPAAALPSILLFLILTVFYVLLVGPANFFIMRRLRRQELLWVTVPLGALLCLGGTFGVAYHLKGNTVLVNTVGMVTLDGSSDMRPTALYMGLFAPVRGDYHLTFDGQALPQYVPQFNGDSGPFSSSSTPLGLRFQEGSHTDIQFLGMNMWSMRDVALHTTVNVPGNVSGKLHIDRHGYIVGAVSNVTPLTLVHPIIVAGRAVLHLPDLPPGKTVAVRVKPYLNIYDYNSEISLWTEVYGQPQFGGPVYIGGPCATCNYGSGVFFFGHGPCCYGPTAPAEHSFNDRIRNAATQIPDAQDVTALGEVLFIAWNQQPLGSISVDGASPQRRDLNLVVSPLSVNFGTGPFALRTGTFGARLVDISPETGTGGCCGPTGTNSVDVGVGGSATFEFDLPSPNRLHFKHLWLNVDAGGADGTDMGRIWDWRAGRWVKVDLVLGYAQLHDPGRFISPSGALVVKLVNTNGDGPAFYQGPGDIHIYDVHRNLQISGDGVAA